VDDVLELSIEIQQTAPKQTLTFVEEGIEFALESLSMSARGEVILDLNALEGNALVTGQASEILTVKTVEGTERIELDSAFQLEAEVSYEVSKREAEAIKDASTKTPVR
jgi:hypothetical protein